VRISVERSGGIAGLRSFHELNAEDLPPLLENTARRMIDDNNRVVPPSRSSVPSGAADHYAYRITIVDGVHQRVIDCNQYNMTNELRLLIKYLENSAKK
jgi:hypothetical protein